MMKTKLFLSLSILLGFIQAHAEIPNLPVPQEFDRLYSVSTQGEILPRYNSVKTPDNIKVKVVDSGLHVFNTSNDTTAWHVGATPCSQNKEFKCVSIYNRKSSKSTGNQQSFLNKNRKDDADFSLIQINSSNPLDNSVIKCNSQFVTGAVRDKADLSGCVKYTRTSCAKWMDVLSSEKNIILLTTLNKKGEECAKMLNDASDLRRSMNSVFQDDLKNSEKEITRNFDLATSDNNGLRIQTELELKKLPELSPNVTIYKDLFERLDDCDKFAYLFTSDKTRAAERLKAALDESPREAKRVKSSKTKTNQ